MEPHAVGAQAGVERDAGQPESVQAEASAGEGRGVRDRLGLVQKKPVAGPARLVGPVRAPVALHGRVEAERDAERSDGPLDAEPRPAREPVDGDIGERERVVEVARDAVRGRGDVAERRRGAERRSRLALAARLARGRRDRPRLGLPAVGRELRSRQGAWILGERRTLDGCRKSERRGGAQADVPERPRPCRLEGGVVAEAVAARVTHGDAGPVSAHAADRFGLDAAQPERPARRPRRHERRLVWDRVEKEDAAAAVAPQRRRRPADDLGAPDEPWVDDAEHGLTVGERQRDAIEHDLHAADAERRPRADASDRQPLTLRRVLARGDAQARHAPQRHVETGARLRRPLGLAPRDDGDAEGRRPGRGRTPRRLDARFGKQERVRLRRGDGRGACNDYDETRTPAPHSRTRSTTTSTPSTGPPCVKTGVCVVVVQSSVPAASRISARTA